MPRFDKERIFNESPKKVLIREYENLKNDYSKLNAIKYKALYENASLSFILENSDYIYSEPIRGCEFYKNIMETAVIPFGALEKEINKVSTYFIENSNKMSDTQRNAYEALLESMNKRYDSIKNSSELYDVMIENKDAVIPLYDSVYEYTKNGNGNIVEEFKHVTENNLMDALNIATAIPELYSEMVMYLENTYVENPSEPDEYALNAYMQNVFNRMMRDSHFSESVSMNPNVNLRHFITGISEQSSNDLIDNIFIEKSDNYQAVYSSPENSVNKVFEDDLYSEMFSEENDKEKLHRLLCEKAVVDMNLGFAILDQGYLETKTPDSVVEKLCVESTTIEKMPQRIEDQILMLENFSNELGDEIREISEKYFSSNFGPSNVVAKSVGAQGADKATDKNKDKKKNDTKSNEEPDFYSPPEKHDDDDDDDEEANKREAAKKRRDDKYANMDLDELEDEENEDDSSKAMHKVADEVGKRRKPTNDEIKKFFIDASVQNKIKTELNNVSDKLYKEKWGSKSPEFGKEKIKKLVFDSIMLVDGYMTIFFNVKGSEFNDPDVFYQSYQSDISKELNDVFKDTRFRFSAEDSEGISIERLAEKSENKNESVELIQEFFGKKKEANNIPGEHYEKIEKPEKRPFFQRVQNKALDTNVQFKKKVAKGERTAQDARNAGKAVAKVPMSVTNSLKKTVSDWDEMDDNRRKAYIIQPGTRKKYFKALKIAIMHGMAFAINPLLNIVLLICHKFSASKDVRIRNELRKELEAEIRVTEEKIEDAKSAGDNQQKYKLMRIKEKLDAELVRVTANAKTI